VKRLYIILLPLLFLCCKENSVEFPFQEEPYTHRWWAFYETTLPVEYIGKPIKFVVNGKFTNISTVEYGAYPVALVAFGRLNYETGVYQMRVSGDLGYTESEDWGQTSTHEERFQPLSLVRQTIRPKETLRVKIFSDWFTPTDSVFVTVVYVINGKQDIPRGQVTW